MKRSPIPRSIKPLKRTPIKQRSARKAKQMKAASDQFARLVFERGSKCQLEELIKAVVPDYMGCTHYAKGRHHLRKQSAGGSDADENCLLSCNECNEWVENEPLLATRASLVVRRGDPRWYELGNGKEFPDE